MTSGRPSRVAVIGIGAMGSRIAERLLSTGRSLVVWNRTRDKTHALQALGAGVANTPAAATAGSDVVITMVSDEAALRTVIQGETGIAAGAHGSTTLIEMSTVGPAAISRLRSTLPRRVRMLDAPVLGSISEAESGTLDIFVGGPSRLVSRHRALLETLGTVEHVGPLGAGAAAKLVANSTLFGSLGVLGEAVALARSLGLSPSATAALLECTPLAAQAARRSYALQTRNFPARFTLALAHKDAKLIVSAADGSRVDMRLARAADSWFQDAEAAGWGDADYSAVLAHIVDRAVSSSRSGSRSAQRKPHEHRR